MNGTSSSRICADAIKDDERREIAAAVPDTDTQRLAFQIDCLDIEVAD